MFLIISHRNCNDGIAAAYVATQHLKQMDHAYEVCFAQYGEDPPDVVGKDVRIFDFSYPRDTLLRMADEAKSIRVYDHHKTAEADLKDLPFCVFDMERSGCQMAWDYYHDGKRPQWLDLVAERDLWRKNENGDFLSDPATSDLHLVTQTLPPNDLDAWHRFVQQYPEPVHWGEGASWLREQRARRIEACANNARIEKIAGVPFAVVCNSDPTVISESADAMCERLNTAGAAHYWQAKEGFWVFSLRGRGGLDVSQVARHYGGGGHPGAAGFRVDRLTDVWPEPARRWWQRLLTWEKP